MARLPLQHAFVSSCRMLHGGLSKPLTPALPIIQFLSYLPCRLLDPQLATSYPSAILARERAIVVNLEFIKCIISLGECCLSAACLCQQGLLLRWTAWSSSNASSP
jgi:hypothetical protein